MTRWLLAVLLGLMTAGCGGCSEVVPPGYVGMRSDSDGLDGTVLEPGRHNCGFRCKLILLETQELLKTEQMRVLCTDDLNIQIDVKIRARLKVTDGDGIKEVLDKQGSRIEDGKLKAEVFYKTYVSPVVRSVTRKHVSLYATTQIREQRDVITKAIETEIHAAVKGTPVEVTFIATSNIDYPPAITEARERTKKRELEIKEERAKQEMELLRAENRLKVAQKTKAARVAEAEGEAAYNTILAKSLSKPYLMMRAIEARTVLYKQVGPGDKVIFTSGDGAFPVIFNKP